MVRSKKLTLVIEGGGGAPPSEIGVSQVLISMDKMHAKPGETVTVEGYVWLQQFVPQGYKASVNLTLYVKRPDGRTDQYDTKTVYVNEGEGVSSKATWQISYDEPGEYEVWIESEDYATVEEVSSYGIAPRFINPGFIFRRGI